MAFMEWSVAGVHGITVDSIDFDTYYILPLFLHQIIKCLR